MGVPEDKETAVWWYRRAAERGHKEAQCTLAVCYARGIDVPRDNAEAVNWLRKAAVQGNGQAIEMLQMIEAQK